MPCKLIGALVQLQVGDVLVLEDEGGRVRTAQHLTVEQTAQSHVDGPGVELPVDRILDETCGVVPLEQYEFSFGRGQNVDVAGTNVRRAADGRDDPQEPVDETVDGLGIEQIRCVRERRRQGSRLVDRFLVDAKLQVEFRSVGTDFLELDDEFG
ncbi:unannotated protein [freshwater metagenome]|uniref:Unannotated protein n=1 Tax=freshwater metagenome TaxID=449393 RepID=A0A6J7G1W8_9ZZZZ